MRFLKTIRRRRLFDFGFLYTRKGQIYYFDLGPDLINTIINYSRETTELCINFGCTPIFLFSSRLVNKRFAKDTNWPSA